MHLFYIMVILREVDRVCDIMSDYVQLSSYVRVLLKLASSTFAANSLHIHQDALVI